MCGIHHRPGAGSAKDKIDGWCNIVGDDNLLEHADRDEGESHGDIERVETDELPGFYLGMEFVQIGNWADDQLRKEADESAITAKRPKTGPQRTSPFEKFDHALFANIGICQKGRLMERVE